MAPGLTIGQVPKGRHHPARTHHHWGTAATKLTFGGRRCRRGVPHRRPDRDLQDRA
jgi:hypothetical protein